MRGSKVSDIRFLAGCQPLYKRRAIWERCERVDSFGWPARFTHEKEIEMEIECLICGYTGEPKIVKPAIRLHWLFGIAEIDKVCPICGDTARDKTDLIRQGNVYRVRQQK